MSIHRTKSLNNISERKIEEKRFAIENNEDPIELKTLKLNLINRYYESNIPLEYWNLEMEKHFSGDPNLLQFYIDYTSDLKASYQEGKGYCLAGAHGRGKMIDLETDMPTPNGFKKLIDLKEGDQLFDENGNICNITKLHPIDLQPESYQITFDDGSIVKACADHLWLTWTRESRLKNEKGEAGVPEVRSTKEVLNSLRVGGKQMITNHSIKNCKPLQYKKNVLPINPYVLGSWLGDGTSNSGQITTMDQDILAEINKEGYSTNLIPSSVRDNNKACNYRIGDLLKRKHGLIGNLSKELAEYNLIKNKHIPKEYLIASYEDRLALLQGLLDTDGSCGIDGKVEFCTVIEELAYSVCDLVRSFGIKTKVKRNKSFLKGVQKKDRYRITFSTKLPVFRLNRKLANLRLEKNQLSRTEHRFITDIKLIDPIPMRCITVDSQSHLFLITKNYIPTHNTMTGTAILKKCIKKGYSCLYTNLSDIVSIITGGPYEDRFYAKKELTGVDFLFIDEWDNRFMANEAASDLYARTLETIIRTRAQNNMPTLFATNSPNIVEAFTGDLKSSLSSLKNGYIVEVPVFGEDFRGKK